MPLRFRYRKCLRFGVGGCVFDRVAIGKKGRVWCFHMKLMVVKQSSNDSV